MFTMQQRSNRNHNNRLPNRTSSERTGFVDSKLMVLVNPNIFVLDQMKNDLEYKYFPKMGVNKPIDKSDSIDSIDCCALCLKNTPSCAKQNLFAWTECKHELCIECILKWIYFSQNTNCPFCRNELKKIYVFALDDKKSINFDELDLEQAHNFELFYFDNKSYENTIVDLIYLTCPKCDYFDQKKIKPKYEDSPLFDDFFNHLWHKHKLKMCKLCVSNFDFFPSQLEVYSKHSFAQHMSQGSLVQDTLVTHHYCNLCKPRKPYFDYSSLLKHCIETHITCYLCDHHTKGYFFADQETLHDHLRKNHFKCPTCMDRGDSFFAFPTFIELRSHCEQVHNECNLRLLNALNKNLLDNTDVVSHRVINDQIDDLLRQKYQKNMDTTSFNPKTEGYLMNFPSINGGFSQNSTQFESSFDAYQRNRPIQANPSVYDNNFPALGGGVSSSSPAENNYSKVAAKTTPAANQKKTDVASNVKTNQKTSNASSSLASSVVKHSNQKALTLVASSSSAVKSSSNPKTETRSNRSTQLNDEFPLLKTYKRINFDGKISNTPTFSMLKSDMSTLKTATPSISSDTKPKTINFSTSILNNEFPSLSDQSTIKSNINVNWKSTGCSLQPLEKEEKIEPKKNWNDVEDFPVLQTKPTNRVSSSKWVKEFFKKKSPVNKYEEPSDLSFIITDNHTERCAKLRNEVNELLQKKGQTYETFKKSCLEYRDSATPVLVFYEKCFKLFGDDFDKLIIDLILSLPNIDKQNELYQFHREQQKKNGNLSKRSPILKCKVCSQLISFDDLDQHNQHHK